MVQDMISDRRQVAYMLTSKMPLGLVQAGSGGTLWHGSEAAGPAVSGRTQPNTW